MNTVHTRPRLNFSARFVFLDPVAHEAARLGKSSILKLSAEILARTIGLDSFTSV